MFQVDEFHVRPHVVVLDCDGSAYWAISTFAMILNGCPDVL